MRNPLRSLLFALAAAVSSAACAHAQVDVQVISRATGLALSTYLHRGRTYVVGNPGEAYALRLTNRSGGRVLAVVSVDGINAISGETAAHGQSGYVLDPWGSAEIKGWRKSMEEVAQFYFTALPDSYAARTGRPGHVGVIGVAVFREHAEPPARQPETVPFAKGAAEAPAAPASAARESLDTTAPGESGAAGNAERRQAERLGTGHGERERSRTFYTEFRRAGDRPAQEVSVFYDSYANLLARGVIPRPPRHVDPQPFPGQFVPDPRG